MMVSRHETETVIEQVKGQNIEVIEGPVEAPLWRMPPWNHDKGDTRTS